MSNDGDDNPVLEEVSEKTGNTEEGPSTNQENSNEKEAGTETPGPVDIMSDEVANVFISIDNAKNKKKTQIEDVYQKKTQLEHILLRPDTYIGSVYYTEEKDMWVYDPEEGKIVSRTIRYVPGLYKIFDEILVNAADNKQRDPKMTCIKINIDKHTNTISVYNNGKGIPVVIHKKEKMYVPELIFGTLLTSSNYDDSEKKVTGGRNGYGAKLCNIFSTEFTLETSSKEYGKAFKQTWVNSMTKDKEPMIVKNSSEDFTKVTFKPDLTKFNMTELDDDIISLMMRRAFDVAGTTPGVKVYLNGKAVPIQGFKQYVELHPKSAPEVIYEKVNNRWEVACCVSEGVFTQVSFVNSIATQRGGTHVDYIADSICRSMLLQIQKKAEKTNIPVAMCDIKQHLWIFVNCLIENPAFDSQTKETLTSNPTTFGSSCELSDNFYKKVMKCGIVESVLAWVDFQQREELRKEFAARKGAKLTGIPKLEDANDAGTVEHSSDCTLIVTEGDSAKTLAVSGLAVVGRDRYGVFPLRGKLLNVREGSIKQMIDNQEISALVRILGLQYHKQYETGEDFKTLRYGKIMIMADQDQDGSHIKGLLINFIHYNWPSLIHNGFVEQFITPIMKAIRGKEELPFFSIPEFKEWQRSTPSSDKYRIKYYKGLGTSTSKEAKEYFSDMARHRIKFTYNGPEDDAAVEMAFSKKKVDERKDWLTKWMDEKTIRRAQGLEEEYLYNKDTTNVTYSEFINKELVLFSNTDNERSIPSLVDGLKPGQRKVIFSCFKRADKREVKVAQLAGAVGELSAYHHGEASLMGTIVNLAQDFVGSNNLNLLLPIGQFGTRLQGGKDSASPRYIFTKLNPMTRVLFPVEDENVLRFLYEDNQRIEPEWYCPIIPMVLVNGANGIGTGWSTNIPNYNPREVVENIRRLIRGDAQMPLKPWYKGFTGEIIQFDNNHFVCNGEVAVLDDNTIEITELPIKTWTQAYKEGVIVPTFERPDRGNKILTELKEYHTDTTVRFVCTFKYPLFDEDKRDLHKTFKLQTVINTTSMVLFDASGCLRRFNTPEEICAEFFEVRKQKYIERKAFLEGMLKAQSDRLSNQARFIVSLVKGDIILIKRTKANILEQLVKLNFDPDPVKKWQDEQKKKLDDGELETEEEEYEENAKGEIVRKGESDMKKQLSQFEYLLSLPMIKVSDEEKRKLVKESEDKLKELKQLQTKSWADLWEEDLTEFLKTLDDTEEQEKKDHETANLKKTGSRRAIAETCPAPNGQRIAPFVDEKALKEKYDKMSKLSKTPKDRNTPKGRAKDKTPRVRKTKKDEWRSDQSDGEEEIVDDDIFEENEEIFKDETPTSFIPSTRARARRIANCSHMAEEVNDEHQTASSSSSSICGEEDEETVGKGTKRRSEIKTNEERLKEKVKEYMKAEKDAGKRAGKNRKKGKSPVEEDDADSDDSVVIIETPAKKEPRRGERAIFKKRLADLDLSYLKDGPSLAKIHMGPLFTKNALPWIFDPTWQPREPTPPPEKPTTSNASKDPKLQLPPEDPNLGKPTRTMAELNADFEKYAKNPVPNGISPHMEMRLRREWRVWEEHTRMQDYMNPRNMGKPVYVMKPFPEHLLKPHKFPATPRKRRASATSAVSLASPAHSTISLGSPNACSTPVSSQSGINIELEKEIDRALQPGTSKDTAEPEVERRPMRREREDDPTMAPEVFELLKFIDAQDAYAEPIRPVTVSRPPCTMPIMSMTPSNMPKPPKIVMRPLEEDDFIINWKKNEEKANKEEEAKKSSGRQRKRQNKTAEKVEIPKQVEVQEDEAPEEEKEGEEIEQIEETPKRPTSSRARKPRQPAAAEGTPTNDMEDKKPEEEKNEEETSTRRTSGRRTAARRRFPGDESVDEAQEIQKTPAGRPKRKVTKKT